MFDFSDNQREATILRFQVRFPLANGEKYFSSSHTSVAGRSNDVVVLFICADVGFRLLSIL